MITTDQYLHSATLLRNGKVLISGGTFTGGRGVLSAAPELYDPTTGTFMPAGDTNASKPWAKASLLQNGEVLITGGWKFDGASVYDPATGTFSFLGNLPAPGLWFHTATSLANGTVLIAGGRFYNGSDAYNDYGEESLGTAQIYDPSSGGFKTTGSLFETRSGHTATLLPVGLVLVAGGEWNLIRSLASVELYDPAEGVFTHTGGMNVDRANHTATLLRDGTVLITGGRKDVPDEVLASAELFVPPVMAASSASLVAPLAPASLASLFGSGLSLVTASADPLPLPTEGDPPSAPTSLGGISVLVHDSAGVARLAPLYYVSPARIDFEVPPGTASGDVTLDVLNSPAQIPPVTVQIRSVAPGLFAFDDGTPVAYALRLEPNNTMTVLSVRNTIVLDDRPVYLILYATGIHNGSSLANVRVTIGGTNLPVEYAGPSGAVPGLDQVNVRLTSALQGTGVANLVLTVDGIASNTVSVDVR
jgi:uncharacterized protein (TIGR03437 family)